MRSDLSGCSTHMWHGLARRNAVLDCNVLPISSVLDPHRAANLPCREHQITELFFCEVIHPRNYPLPRTIRGLKMSESSLAMAQMDGAVEHCREGTSLHSLQFHCGKAKDRNRGLWTGPRVHRLPPKIGRNMLRFFLTLGQTRTCPGRIGRRLTNAMVRFPEKKS